MEARIYVRGGRMQVRQAKMTCQFDANGQVVAALKYYVEVGVLTVPSAAQVLTVGGGRF
jgi:hypothetical protein